MLLLALSVTHTRATAVSHICCTQAALAGHSSVSTVQLASWNCASMSAVQSSCVSDGVLHTDLLRVQGGQFNERMLLWQPFER